MTQTMNSLYRREAPQTSIKAASKISANKLAQLVLEEVLNAGENGITTKEIRAKHKSYAYSSITARPKSLEEEGAIFYRGDSRDGCRVMRVTALMTANDHRLQREKVEAQQKEADFQKSYLSEMAKVDEVKRRLRNLDTVAREVLSAQDYRSLRIRYIELKKDSQSEASSV